MVLEESKENLPIVLFVSNDFIFDLSNKGYGSGCDSLDNTTH